MAGIRKVEDGIENQLEKMLDRSNRMQAYLDRIVYRQYQNAQRQRWITENSSEGEKWVALNPTYKERKKTLFADYDGQGEKTLIATGRLYKSVIGPGGDHRKIVTNTSIEVGWGTPYAEYVDEKRPFHTFGPETMGEIYRGLAKFIMQGVLRDMS